MDNDPLIPKHGGYRKLKTFQLAQLIYDVTVLFFDRYIDRRSRTHDQMVQAARSGAQYIAEGSKLSGTSKKLELKLTNVARASLEELKLDYEDYLRQHGLEQWAPEHPVLNRFRAARCSTLEEFRVWIAQEHRLLRDAAVRTDTDAHRRIDAHGRSGLVRVRPNDLPDLSELVANAVRSLLNLNCHFLDRQLAAQARAFEEHGGFTERLYTRRQQRRRGS